MKTLRLAFLFAVLAGLLHSACRRPHVVPSPPLPPAPPPPVREDTFALLPDPDDGSVGRVSVSNAQGTVELSDDRAFTLVAPGKGPTPAAIMDRADVQARFGEALSTLPPAPRHFTLNFELGSEQLTGESRALFDGVLQAVGERPFPDVIVIGHTDRVGSAASNYALALRRAMAVRDLLVMAGLRASSIQAVSHGEADLLVSTPDDTAEPRNRRVEIEVQ